VPSENLRIPRLQVTLEGPHGSLLLPLPYNYLLQGLLYHHLDKAAAEWLHDIGYFHSPGKRTYKLFTFSLLEGACVPVQEAVTFLGPVSFKVATVDVDLLLSLARNLVVRSEVPLYGQLCSVHQVALLPEPCLSVDAPIHLRALSPITISSTRGNRRHYYAPHEAEWSPALLQNLLRKATALGIQVDAGTVLQEGYVRPVHVSPYDRLRVPYKVRQGEGEDATLIEGWLGVYQAYLPEPLFWVGYHGGLGARNAQGFGMVEIVP